MLWNQLRISMFRDDSYKIIHPGLIDLTGSCTLLGLLIDIVVRSRRGRSRDLRAAWVCCYVFLSCPCIDARWVLRLVLMAEAVCIFRPLRACFRVPTLASALYPSEYVGPRSYYWSTPYISHHVRHYFWNLPLRGLKDRSENEKWEGFGWLSLGCRTRYVQWQTSKMGLIRLIHYHLSEISLVALCLKR